MACLIDITGQRFGRLLVEERAGSQKGKACWLCRCECGNTKVILGESLRRGVAKSCGCLRKEITSATMTKHGKSSSRIYNIWQNMLKRCLDSSIPCYHRYGGRGITVDKRWLDFGAFYDDMKDGYSDDLTIDRIDNNGNYTPENCRWATHSQQSVNREGTLFIEYRGQRIPLIDVADACKVNYFTFREAMNRLAGLKKGEIAQ